MADVTILTESDLRACVALDLETVDVIDRAFATLAGGGVVMPPILSLAIPDHHGDMDVKTAYVPGLESFAIKLASGFHDNAKLGLPSSSGLMVLFDSKTGFARALLLDNGYLTDLRTAAAGAVAAKHLAPEGIETAGVFGAGVQADLQMRALQLVRPFARLLVWARDPAKAGAYAARMSAALGCPVEVAESAEACVRESQVVVTTTPSQEPLIQAQWLHPGLHITAMGSDTGTKGELDPKIAGAADRFVCDRRQQSVTLGELRSAIAAGIVPEDWPVDELGEISAGTKPGRANDQEVTVCDLVGTGMQDTAIATHVFRLASEQGLGTVIES
ncbi:MAG: cyclodeaminase [Pseudomonadota bacterium]